MRQYLPTAVVPPPTERGFTLLEMVVVLAILGLATALVVPTTLRGIDAWRRQAALTSVVDQVRALPGNARASGRPIVVNDATLEGTDAAVRSPSDWTLTVPTPWTVTASGVCSAGELQMGNAYGSRKIQVAAPFCEASVE